MSTSPQSILFLSGAGLPAWIWDDVRRELSAYPTQVAPRPQDARGLQDYATAAIAAVTTHRFTIVAHSAGGVVGARIAQLVPERVAGFLAISAVIPAAGGSFLSAMPLPNRWILGIAMRVAGTRPPDSAIRGSLAHGLTEPTVDRLIADFTPEPLAFYRDRIERTTWQVPGAYLGTADDRELPAALQQRFAARLGATPGGPLSTGHLPMLEDPASVAHAITQFLER